MGNQEEKHPLLEQDRLPLHPGHISLITSFLADFSEQEAIYLSSWRQRRPSGKEHWMKRRRFIVQSNEPFTWNISITQSRPYKWSCKLLNAWLDVFWVLVFPGKAKRRTGAWCFIHDIWCPALFLDDSGGNTKVPCWWMAEPHWLHFCWVFPGTEFWNSAANRTNPK